MVEVLLIPNNESTTVKIQYSQWKSTKHIFPKVMLTNHQQETTAPSAFAAHGSSSFIRHNTPHKTTTKIISIPATSSCTTSSSFLNKSQQLQAIVVFWTHTRRLLRGAHGLCVPREIPLRRHGGAQPVVAAHGGAEESAAAQVQRWDFCVDMHLAALRLVLSIWKMDARFGD